MKRRYTGLLIIFFLLIIATIYFSLHTQDHKPAQAATEADTLDTFATQVHITNLDKTGHIDTQLYTPLMTHYTKKNTRLKTPELSVHVKNQPPWKITAKTGEIRQNNEEVFLRDDVVLHQPAGEKNEEVTVATQTLTIYPNKKFATTEDPITLMSRSAQISSVGMQADLTQGTLELKTQAKGLYETPAPG